MGRKLAAVAAVDVRRFGRDRSNLFFAFVFPIALILVIGIQFGGEDRPRLGVAGPQGAVARAVLAELGEDVEVVEVAGGDLADRVASTDLDAGVVFPADLDAAVADGEEAEVGVVVGTTTQGQQLRTLVDQATARAAAEPTAVVAAVERGADAEAAAAVAAERAEVVDRVTVRTVTTGDRVFPAGTEGFDVAAPSQLVLFTIVNGLTGAYALIVTRQLGVATRMLSTPTSVGTVVVGQALGRLVLAIVQGAYILVATMVLFGVDWGDPLGALAVLVAVAAVAAGGAMCLGSFFSNPEQASGVGTVIALALAALGGAMLPIELFSDTLASVARYTPHYWAIDAYAELIRHDGTLVDVLPQIGVMLAFAGAFLGLASWRLRRVLTGSRHSLPR